MPNRNKGKGKTQSRGKAKGKGKANETSMPMIDDSSKDMMTQTRETQQDLLLTLEPIPSKEPSESAEQIDAKAKGIAYTCQEDISMSTPPPPAGTIEEEQEQDVLTEPKRDKGKQKAIFEAEPSSSSSSSSSLMPDPESDEYASSSEYEHDWISDDADDDEEEISGAGIFEVGESDIGVSEAGLSEAIPPSHTHKRQKMDAPVQETEQGSQYQQQQQQQRQQKFYSYSWDVQFDYPGSSPVCICLQFPSTRHQRQQETRFIVRQEDYHIQLNRVLGHLHPLFTTIEAATPSPASCALPLTHPYPLYRACIRVDESGILELLHGDWISSIPEALRSLYNILVVAPDRFRGNWPVGAEEFRVFEGECSGCGKSRQRRKERRWYQVIVQAGFPEEPGRNWERRIEWVNGG